WRALLAEHSVSESYLRTLLRNSEIPLDPLVDGVHQDSLDALEHSLLALLDTYESAKSSGDREIVSASRKAVISGKDHAKWAHERASDPAKKSEKDEMIQWMLMWLENPPLFRDWIRVRRTVLAKEPTEVPPSPPE
ncbi:MAG: hypothetical protein ABI823_17275, partial [Bryobacteraceae bacterium]